MSSPREHLTEYIAVTKRICHELGENTSMKDCTEIYQKTKEILKHYKTKRDTHETPPERKRRPSIPSGKMLLARSLQQTRVWPWSLWIKANTLPNVGPSLMTPRYTNLVKTPPKTAQRHPRSSLTAQQRPWNIRTKLVE